MISVHLDGLRRADVVSAHGTRPQVILRVGAFDRVSLVVKSDAQARIIATAINAAIDPGAPILTERPGGA